MKSIYTNGNSIFPNQVVSDAEKASWEYGSQVAQILHHPPKVFSRDVRQLCQN